MKSEGKRKKHLTILAINCGSSSLKCRVIRMPEDKPLLLLEAERVGIRSDEPSIITYCKEGKKTCVTLDMPDHAAAFRAVWDICQKELPDSIDCFAHRYVHAGTLFKETTVVDHSVIHKLRMTLGYAPLHNPICFSLIELCFESHPQKKHIVVFDTSFHTTIPDSYARYALPIDMVKKYGYRRVGFHGISHEYVMTEACRALNVSPKTQRVISCHLGSGGSSVCAIDQGKSINSSMGFTPLEGLLMNTRSGDIDIGLLFDVMFRNDFSADSAEKILNRKSGVLGVFKKTSDLRDVIKNASNENNIVVQMYVKRVRKYIGYYAMLLKKADVLIFTDTLGVQVASLREAICRNLEILGIKIDIAKNNTYTHGIMRIEHEASETTIMIVPTDEEGMIARAAYRRLYNESNN
jgi:acetate kinase